MKKIKSVIKIILKSIVFHILLWVLMVVIVQKNFNYVGFLGSGEKWPGVYLQVEHMNAPEETAYVDILVKMDDEDSNYVDFTRPPRQFEGEIIGGQEGYIDLPITRESEIAKWNEDGYVSLTLHHKDVHELRIDEWYENGEGSFIATHESLDIYGSFRMDIYAEYDNVKVAYVDEEGKVLKVTDKSKIKYMGHNTSDNIAVDGDSVVFRIGEAPPWIALLFYLSVIMIPVYPIILIVWAIKKAK